MTAAIATDGGRIAVFGPSPILTVTIEPRPDSISDDIHLHAGGQGVWVARMAAELGASPVLCGMVGGEVGAVLEPLLAAKPYACRLSRTAGVSGSYVMDRRLGHRQPIATAWGPAPTRHELDDLFSITCATALESDLLVVCNPLPDEALPAEFYDNLVRDVRANGVPVLVDLSSPRLEAALAGGPDLVKLNDWELAQYVVGPVAEPGERDAAMDRLVAAGAGSVLLTRAEEPAFGVRQDGARFQIVPPRFTGGSHEGCGDSMMGGIAAAWSAGADWLDSMIVGTAAGAANYLRHGLGSAHRDVVTELVPRVVVRPG